MFNHLNTHLLPAGTVRPSGNVLGKFYPPPQLSNVQLVTAFLPFAEHADARACYDKTGSTGVKLFLHRDIYFSNLSKTSVALNETSVALNETSVALNETSVALNETSVALNETSVALNKTSVALNETSVALNETSVEPSESSGYVSQSLRLEYTETLNIKYD
jgi:hypothetical protein